jgi:hypothetical protein
MRVTFTLVRVVFTRCVLNNNININLSCRHVAAAVLKKLSHECVSNQHSAWHCYRAVLRVNSTRIRVGTAALKSYSAVCRIDTQIFTVYTDQVAFLV